MTIEEILTGEKENIEYKVDISPKSETYMRTVVAFANGSGGRLVFGVKDGTWEVVAFNKDEVFAKMDAITNAIFDSCEPRIIPNLSVQDFNGKYIIIVDIPAGMQCPYYLKSQGLTNGTYLRVGGTTRRAESFQVKELIVASSNNSYDQEKINRILTEEEIDAFCGNLYEQARNFASAESLPMLKRIGKNQLLSYKLIYEENGKIYATHGYQLLEGKLDDYPYATVQCAVFKGTERNIFIDRKEFKGPIYKEVEDAYNFVLQNIKLGAYIEGVARRDVYELPVRAIREIITNAVCHRSYLSPFKIQVAVFDDRLEVTTPGSLDRSITVKQLKTGISKVRNRGIAEVFAYLTLIEAWGTGIPRIFSEAKALGLPEPELLDRGSDFRINLFRSTVPVIDTIEANGTEFGTDGTNLDANGTKVGTDGTNLDANGTKVGTDGTNLDTNSIQVGVEIQIDNSDYFSEIEKLILAIRENSSVTQKELHQKTGIALRTIKRLTVELQKSGKLTRMGSNRSGTWKVID